MTAKKYTCRVIAYFKKTFWIFDFLVFYAVVVACSLILGSLSNDDGEVYENVVWKVNSCCFKLNRAFFISFNSSNVGRFFWLLITKDCIEVQEKEKRVVLCPRPLKNVKLGNFTSWSCRDGKEMCKLHVQNFCFANLNLLLFYRSRCRRRSRCLSSRIY